MRANIFLTDRRKNGNCFFIISSERLLILPPQTTGARCKAKNLSRNTTYHIPELCFSMWKKNNKTKHKMINAVKSNLSKWTTKSGRLVRWDSSQRSAVSSGPSRRKQTSAWRSSVASVAHCSVAERSYWSVEVCRFIDIYIFFFFPFFLNFFFHIKILSSIFHWLSQCDRCLECGVGAHGWVAGICQSWGRYSIWGLAVEVEAPGWSRHPSSISDAVVKQLIVT